VAVPSQGRFSLLEVVSINFDTVEGHEVYLEVPLWINIT
jgi:hypothetical protein